jgi:hypothetical protein
VALSLLVALQSAIASPETRANAIVDARRKVFMVFLSPKSEFELVPN